MSRCVAALKYSDMNDAMHGWMRLNRVLRYSKYNYACILLLNVNLTINLIIQSSIQMWRVTNE